MSTLSIILFSCYGKSSSDDSSSEGINTLREKYVCVLGEPRGWRNIVISDGDFTWSYEDIITSL